MPNAKFLEKRWRADLCNTLISLARVTGIYAKGNVAPLVKRQTNRLRAAQTRMGVGSGTTIA